MQAVFIFLLAAVGTGNEQLKPGDSTRTVTVQERERTYLVHVPPKYDAKTPAAVVVALHGAWTNGRLMELYSGLDKTADEKNFIVVYPNGTGPNEMTLFWNSGRRFNRPGTPQVDDVAFIGKVLDDLESAANIDTKRVFATGISNGGMMCHRLAAEMSDRIAAIAPVSGTLCLDDIKPKRPVSVIEFHGTDDRIVPYDGRKNLTTELLGSKSVEDTISVWVKLDGCPEKPKVDALSHKADDATKVFQKTYGPGKDGSEVVLIEIDGGGHTWPGAASPPAVGQFLGNTTHDISANEMLWDFFKQHPTK